MADPLLRPDTGGALEPPGVFHSLRNFTASLVTHAHTRLQLFAIELAEEQLRLAALLFYVLLGMSFLFLALLLASFLVIAAAWDSPYRLHAVGGLMLVFLLCASALGGMVRARLKAGPRLFQASLAELYKDRHQLNSNEG